MSEVKVVKTEPVTVDLLEQQLADVTEMMFLPVGKSVSLPRSSVRLAQPAYIRQHGCILPPYDARQILAYKALDITYQTCLDIRADACVGMGYYFSQKEINKRKDILDFFKTPNRNFSDTMTSIFKNTYMDLQLFENCYMEYVKSGKRYTLHNLPSKDMYIRPKGNTREVDKYVFMPSGVFTPIEYEPYPVDGKTKDGVHYCIHIRRPSSDNIYYGKPDTAHLFDLIKISYLSDQYNINFFSNGGQPAYAILITGGKMSKKSYQKIQDFIKNNLKGVHNSHNMLFLSVPGERATIQLVPLSSKIDEQFITLNDKIQFKIALKCRVYPKLLGLNTGGNFGGGSAGITDLKLFLETVVKAEQQFFAEYINKFLELEFGIDCEFGFRTINIMNEKDDAVNRSLYFKMVDEYGNRVLDVNEVRHELNLKPIDLKHTPIDESNRDEDFSINVSEDGRLRSSDKSTLGIDSQASENFDPNKNNDERV